MSALSLATLGVQCKARALSMATLGVFCIEDLGTRTYRDFWREYYDDWAIREDEEMILFVRAFLGILERWH